MDEPKGAPTHEIAQIYPEVYQGAAGQSSSGIFKYSAKDKFVEYFPQKVVQAGGPPSYSPRRLKSLFRIDEVPSTPPRMISVCVD